MKVKKVCLVGDFAVGKTSLVARFVNHTFSDRYLTTVGVSIKTKIIERAPVGELKLIIWDIAGEDKFSRAAERYLHGAHGLLVVADGTRSETIEVAAQLQAQALALLGDVPVVNLLNKADLRAEWPSELPPAEELTDAEIYAQIPTSAKTGLNVEFAFLQLAAQLE